MAKKKPYRFAIYLLLRGVNAVIQAVPRKMALGIAKAGGALAFYTVERQRKKTLDHLRLAYGNQKSEAEIRKIGLEVFENLAMTGAEVLQFKKLTPEKIAEIVDFGNARGLYDEILSRGKGLISVTAHIGNWELLAGSFGMMGYKGGVLARRLYYEPYNQWVVGLRAALKVPTIYRDDSSREILKTLQRNEIIGLLPDQDIDSLKGVFVPFFGRPAYTPVAPARLSIGSGAPVVPNFLVRVPGGNYKVIVGSVIDPVKFSGETKEAAAEKMTQEWMSQFEKVIREYPGQWAWMHPRWKTTPESLKLKTPKDPKGPKDKREAATAS